MTELSGVLLLIMLMM